MDHIKYKIPYVIAMTAGERIIQQIMAAGVLRSFGSSFTDMSHKTNRKTNKKIKMMTTVECFTNSKAVISDVSALMINFLY